MQIRSEVFAQSC